MRPVHRSEPSCASELHVYRRQLHRPQPDFNPEFTLTPWRRPNGRSPGPMGPPATLTVNIRPERRPRRPPVAPTTRVRLRVVQPTDRSGPHRQQLPGLPLRELSGLGRGLHRRRPQSGEDLTTHQRAPGIGCRRLRYRSTPWWLRRPTGRAGSTTITVTHVTQPGGSCPDGTTPQFTLPVRPRPSPPPTTTTTSTTTTTTVPVHDDHPTPSTTTHRPPPPRQPSRADDHHHDHAPAPPPVLALPAGQWQIDWGGSWPP